MKRKTLGIFAMAFLLSAMGLEVQAKAAKKGELTGVVNVNEAGVSELTMLPGVGPKRAQAISDYAKAHPFKSVEELKEIKGIGEKGLEKLKPYVTVAGSTTAKWLKATTAQTGQPRVMQSN